MRLISRPAWPGSLRQRHSSLSNASASASSFFEGMAFDPRDNRRHKPFRLAHLDHRENTVFTASRNLSKAIDERAFLRRPGAIRDEHAAHHAKSSGRYDRFHRMDARCVKE